MSHVELDSFFCKFKFLWYAGYDANLRVETNAGEAKVILEAGLGPFTVPTQPFNFPHGHDAHHVRHHNSPAQKRRRERREAARRDAATIQDNLNDENAVEASEVVDAEKVSTNTAEKALETIQAGKATTQESNNTVAEEAKDSNHVQCDLCDSEFRNTRGLKTHKGRVHKNISQMDGFIEEQDLDENCVFTFESTYAEEDIKYTLVELLSEEIVCELISRVKIGNVRSANHLCKVIVSIPRDDWQWPVMGELQAEVLKNLKMSPSCC